MSLELLRSSPFFDASFVSRETFDPMFQVKHRGGGLKKQARGPLEGGIEVLDKDKY